MGIENRLTHVNCSPEPEAPAARMPRLFASLALSLCLFVLPGAAFAGSKKKPTLNDTVGSRSMAGRGTRGKLVATRRSAHTRRRRARRQTEYQRRIAKVHLEPQRVQEIQRALGQAGYLHQEPNGLWDTDTRAAMERYQQDHGFALTGLPDARSLMKLGLGPHPLPSEADPKTTADSVLSTRPSTSDGERQPPN